MYKTLLDKARNAPEMVVAMRAQCLADLRTPSRMKRLEEMFDELHTADFSNKAVAASTASREAADETTTLLRTILTYILAGELLLQVGHGPIHSTEEAHQAHVFSILAFLREHVDCLPGIISHYDALGCRNAHDSLILQCLQLGYLQAIA